MSRTTKVGAVIQELIHQRPVGRSFQSNNGSLGLCFTSAASNPAQGIVEEGQQKVKNAMDAAKDATQSIKDKVMGKAAEAKSDGDGGGVSEKQPTDSSVEDVRERPGGYS